MKYSLLFLLLVFAQVSLSQSCSRVWLKGKVVDTLNPNKFLNLMIVNQTSGKGVFGQPNGTFGVYVSNNDSIILSIKGYDRIGFRVKADSMCQFNCDYAVIEIPTQIDEVIIKPLKTLQQIKEERAALAMRETRTITGIEAVQSPITALYQRFSKVEQSKAKVAELEYMDSKTEIVREILKLYVLYEVVNLNEDEFEDFIGFMTIDENFLKTASDVELATFVKDKYEHYILLHPRTN